jgi:hypothetical protein
MSFNFNIFARLTDRSVIAIVRGVVALARIIVILAVVVAALVFAAFLAVGAGWVTVAPLLTGFLFVKALAVMACML